MSFGRVGSFGSSFGALGGQRAAGEPSEPPEEDIFAGLTAGSTVGIVGAGGSLPNGWAFVPQDDATAEVLQATHSDDGVECIQIKFVSPEADGDSIFRITTPGADVAEGETWKIEGYIRTDLLSDDGQVIGFAGLNLLNGEDYVIFNEDLPADGGPLQASYRVGSGEIPEGVTAITGMFEVYIDGSGELTITIAIKISEAA